MLKARTLAHTGYSRVIVRSKAGSMQAMKGAGTLLRGVGGVLRRQLPKSGSQVAIVPNAALRSLAANPMIERVSLDRSIAGAMDRTGTAVGAAAARLDLGVDGAGVGVAVIDSGVTQWHDDLSDSGTGQRVVEFVDFVDGITTPHDDYGHGTHVAGIIAGNGFDSDGARTGIAPGAHLVVLKVLDDAGRGYISDVIAAIDYAVDRRDELSIRIINLSVAAGVYESYNDDPLALAAQRAVRAGITVVAAAGNYGRSPAGNPQYGGITSPGNAPWVLTVGASSHMGTTDRTDDTIAAFTSRGPTAIDHAAKPDVVAPGIGTESLSTPGSTLYTTWSDYLLPGTRPTPLLPYLSLSGTSMSAPVVSGTVALMLQANPSLTPNAVKAILQYTAEIDLDYDPLTEGGGFVNAKGAVELSRYLVSPTTTAFPDASRWNASLIWGNRLVRGGRLGPDANAWGTSVMWGADRAHNGWDISWGARCTTQSCETTSGKWRLGQSWFQNVVWGAICSGGNCDVPWSLAFIDSTDGGETVVWGTDGGETVVWGTDDGETVVWGTDEGETVVWGTSCTDPSCTPIIWGRQ